MDQPRQFRLTSEEVFAMQRNGTVCRDLEIADWMGRSESVRRIPCGRRGVLCRHPQWKSPGGCR